MLKLALFFLVAGVDHAKAASDPLKIELRQFDDFGLFLLGDFNDLLLSLQHLDPPSACDSKCC